MSQSIYNPYILIGNNKAIHTDRFFNQKIICDYLDNQIILDDLTTFSLVDLKVNKTKYSDLIRT